MITPDHHFAPIAFELCCRFPVALLAFPPPFQAPVAASVLSRSPRVRLPAVRSIQPSVPVSGRSGARRPARLPFKALAAFRGCAPSAPPVPVKFPEHGLFRRRAPPLWLHRRLGSWKLAGSPWLGETGFWSGGGSDLPSVLAPARVVLPAA